MLKKNISVIVIEYSDYYLIIHFVIILYKRIANTSKSLIIKAYNGNLCHNYYSFNEKN